MRFYEITYDDDELDNPATMRVEATQAGANSLAKRLKTEGMRHVQVKPKEIGDLKADFLDYVNKQMEHYE